MSANDVHHDWLALIEISGPFLAVPILKEAFPQGLDELDGLKRKRLRQAYEEWREALETDDPQFAELHAAWIDEVLSRGLELDEDGKGDVLKRADWCTANLKASLPEHGVTLSPDLSVVDEQRANKPLMLIQTYAQDVDLDATLKLDGWASTPADRMVQLCRAAGCRLGLVTNGERWMLVDAPVGAVTTFASWYARIWSQEPITLQAFVHLLGIRRFFVDEAEQLPALFDRSLKYQDDVTDALGEQVRRAVEVLIQALDKADQDRDRELLRDVKESELYEAALTVMMRLVFLLSAEERGLLLLGDERYEAYYALSTLRMQLRKESEEILERRWDAWSRLLAIFRAVFGGIEHENLRLPALGGSLFDPDRFPFLEGRAKGSNWRTDAAKPLPIDNRTVLLLLEAIQQFQGRTLSYRALDVEQIGYVYEGLLERTVKRTAEVTLELDGTKNAKSPWVRLAELESARLDGAERLAELLQERSGSSASRVRNDLARPVDDTLADRLLAACHGDTALRDRVRPYAHLVRTDPWGYPLVYPAGASIVTTGSDRRETGTHYTPKSLTEAIVTETLTPIAYVGAAEGKSREQWVLKPPAELLDFKICDPAMGSGAFLVQACRWLADRLVEAWSQTEATGKTVSVDGEVLDTANAKEPLPRDTEARTVIARRLIAERCLYGVDLNPLAVELAKLSIWLVTLAKGRPFGFLDHNLRCGDSLLGIHRLDQLTELSMTPTGKGQQRLFGQNIERAVREAIGLRQRLRAMPIRDIHDVEAMARLDADARKKLEIPELIADAFIGDVLISGGKAVALDNAVTALAIQAERAIVSDRNALQVIARHASDTLNVDLPNSRSARRPFHWPLEFPEVFSKNGFDAIIGNPPFLGGTKLEGVVGSAQRKYMVQFIASGVTGVRGAADLVSYFFLKAKALINQTGLLTFLATDSVIQGDSKVVCLNQLLEKSYKIFFARSSFPWSGSAVVRVVIIGIASIENAVVCKLDGLEVDHINADLEVGGVSGEAFTLQSNSNIAFEGAKTAGTGFILNKDDAIFLLKSREKNINVVLPYLGGDDINNHPNHLTERYVINFKDLPLEGGANEESASDYPECLSIVRAQVKPDRDALPPKNSWNKGLKERWWQFGLWRPALYSATKNLNQCIVTSRVTAHHNFAIVNSNQVMSDRVVVFARDDYAFFAVLSSTIHYIWAHRPGSTKQGTTLNYLPTRAFGSFPMPILHEKLALLGSQYESKRQDYLIGNNIGLTSFYNRFHNPEFCDPKIDELRDLHGQIDCEVTSNGYGWSDIDVFHGFFETDQGIRFTIVKNARLEIYRRLMVLNRERYEDEVAVAVGLHGDITGRASSRSSRCRRDARTESVQPAFDFDSYPSPTTGGNGSAVDVLAFLKSNGDWCAKADILAATRISDAQWKPVIDELIASGKVERQGEKRGARYRFVAGGN